MGGDILIWKAEIFIPIKEYYETPYTFTSVLSSSKLL